MKRAAEIKNNYIRMGPSGTGSWARSGSTLFHPISP